MIQHTKRINLINPQPNSIVSRKRSLNSSHEISDKISMGAMNELVSTSAGGKAY